MKSKNTSFSLAKRLKSFKHAFDGLKVLWIEEHNARVHVAATILVTALGFYFSITITEWFVLIFCFMSVITTEIINSAIENLSDTITTAFHPLIKKAKDLGAAAVTITALASAIIGGIIFIPKIIPLICR